MLVRALIVLFAVLNLGVATWWIAHAPPSAPASVPPPASVARLQLVGENAKRTRPAPKPEATTASNAAPPISPTPPAVADIAPPPVQQCFAFGPFATKDAGIAAAAKLKPLVQRLATREQPGAAANTSAHGWRVYLPPLPSLEQAQTVAQRIGAAGFSDFLVVRDGPEAHSIALGRYGSEAAAKKRADALNAAGFAAQAEAVGAPTATTTLWLDVVADEGFEPRRAQAAIGAAQYRKAACAVRR